MSKLSFEAKLFWIFNETVALNLATAADGQAQLTITDEQNETNTYTGTLPEVLNAAYLEISPDAEADVKENKARDLFSKLTFGLVDSSLEHQAEKALYETEQASS
ncbi:hypothetical protein [Pantoea sp. CCBC3-3-1]|uniref:hypothetical protein n=1 Tax=Pantoea sp. CCBC3-3-1 TaxID=2490851 RepID=UPI0011BF7D74|nr:hypothetical protein [Pantoea sp. CCBC3-3-1]